MIKVLNDLSLLEGWCFRYIYKDGTSSRLMVILEINQRHVKYRIKGDYGNSFVATTTYANFQGSDKKIYKPKEW